ncbi:MAG TPA: D-sedoheptulose 7-phosphate isomerase [Candidatus Omnitrophota bacterium]|nr:D-sedoheptulose 7-phosphate isomerase [Candidatus Omnitrophota bacterium]
MKDNIKSIILDSIKAKEELASSSLDDIAKAAGIIIEAIKGGGKLLIFGNGGSAADSQHMAAELVGRFKKERRPWPAIALTTNTSTLTAIANDYSYDDVFTRQLSALGKPGDVALGISTSGNSSNVIKALKTAQEMGIKTIGLTGKLGGKITSECDVTITVPAKETPRIQECHLLLVHIICEIVEDALA